MEHAVELAHSSKSFHSMVCRRLEIISHEDCDTDRTIVPFVKACGGEVVRRGADRRIKDGDRQCDPRDGARAEVTHGDPFGAAIGLRSELEGFVPQIPDFAYDQHTLEGRRRGRGLQHFRDEGALLIPPPSEPDEYETEAALAVEGGAAEACEARPVR